MAICKVQQVLHAVKSEEWNGCERGTEKTSEWSGINGGLVGKYLAKFSFNKALAEWLNI